MIDSVNVLHVPLDTDFGDVLSSQSLGLVLKIKLNITQRNQETQKYTDLS